MSVSRKYLVAVTLLAVLAVVFGLAGTVAPITESISPQESSSSSSTTHFMYPPTFDSGWVDIRNKTGQYFNMSHDLYTTEVLVDIMGRQNLSGTDGEHQKNFGGTVFIPGWNRTYGAGSTDWAYSMVQTSDRGYVLAGYTDSFIESRDFWLVKADSLGNMKWSKTYGGAMVDEAYSVIETSDRGYALAGTTQSSGAGYSDFWLVKTDSFGNVKWSNTYGGIYFDEAWCVVQTSDGGYAVAGITSSPGAAGYDAWLVKTNSSGYMLWNRMYGGIYSDEARSMVQTSDGGYALAGCTNSYGAGGRDFWLVKTDSAGNMLWNKTYGGWGHDAALSIIPTCDGGYAMAGYTYSFDSFSYDFWLVKTDADGNMKWNRKYGGTGSDYAHCVVQTLDGGYAVVGETDSYGAGRPDFWLVKTDANGDMLWSRTYGGTEPDVANCFVQTDDQGYALAGYTYSYGVGSGDLWLVKTDVGMGLAWTGLTNSTITLYRGGTDPYWNYVRVRIWIIQEPTWQYGDINQDGKVDVKDLYILSRNYGTTFSLLSLTGIAFIASIHTYKTRKQPKQAKQAK